MLLHDSILSQSLVQCSVLVRSQLPLRLGPAFPLPDSCDCESARTVIPPWLAYTSPHICADARDPERVIDLTYDILLDDREKQQTRGYSPNHAAKSEVQTISNSIRWISSDYSVHL
jgi:hypothetical protein